MTEAPLVVERLARIEEKLDAILFRAITVEAKLDIHETRIRLLEVGYGKIVAAAGIVAFIVSAVSGSIHL